MRFEPWIYILAVSNANHYTKESTASERHRKAWLQSFLTGFCWNRLRLQWKQLQLHKTHERHLHTVFIKSNKIIQNFPLAICSLTWNDGQWCMFLSGYICTLFTKTPATLRKEDGIFFAQKGNLCPIKQEKTKALTAFHSIHTVTCKSH